MDLNARGTIYYGTDIKYLEELDSKGQFMPRERKEQYISVSISAYESSVEMLHEDLKEMARIYSEDLKICKIKNNKMAFYEGYENTLTYIQGFGPNPSDHLITAYGLIKNVRTKNTLTAVLAPACLEYLLEPDKENEFEYMSLALHGFMKEIKAHMIAGWIVPDGHYEDVMHKMNTGILKRRHLWKESEIGSMKFDIKNKTKYAMFPNNLEMYIKNLSTNKYHSKTRIDHLKIILRDFKNIDWHMEDEYLEDMLNQWLNENQDNIKWHDEENKYIILR